MWLSIDSQSPRPIYLQIILQIKDQIRRGSLKAGDELPSVRELADSLGINMHTVRNAYLRLHDQGLINLSLGRRATIAKIPQPADKQKAVAEIEGRLAELTTDALLLGLAPPEIRAVLERQKYQLGSDSKTGGSV
jgi:GntR family transcriptional regulator